MPAATRPLLQGLQHPTHQRREPHECRWAQGRRKEVLVGRVDQGGESKAAVDFEEIGEDSIFASDEQQKEVECTADEDRCRLIQREWEGALEGGKRLGRVAGTENAGGSDRSNLREEIPLARPVPPGG